jgi:putative membrane protein
MTSMKEIEETVEETWDEVTTGAVKVLRGTVAGMIGGALASWVMNQYQQIESRPVNVRRAESAEQQSKPVQSQKAQASGDDATVKTAQAIATRFLDHKLSPLEKKIAGPVIHYGYGAAVGALYGGLAELAPIVGIGLGIPYATALFLAGDEIAVPALGLSEPVTEIAPEKHVSALATHFVYGITLDISRRILRRLI